MSSSDQSRSSLAQALASALGAPATSSQPSNSFLAGLLRSSTPTPPPTADALVSLLRARAQRTLLPSERAPLVAAGLGLPPASPAVGNQWVAVAQRFEQCAKNLKLTTSQLADGATKFLGVARCLTSHYYGDLDAIKAAFTFGSWGKDTKLRPPRDIDLCFIMPREAFSRFQAYQWNRQSALLQEVKNVLAQTYPATDMRGDGQVVMVNFESYAVEVVPVFSLANGKYLICDTHDGGRYKITDPSAERARIDAVDAACNRNLRPMIRMLKAWQSHCSVPIKSFLLELVAAEFLEQSQWRTNGFFYYDWLVRDFFAYLYGRAQQFITVPGTSETVFLGDDWNSRALSAYGRSVKACEYEKDNMVDLAGQEWQKIFGPFIPVAP